MPGNNKRKNQKNKKNKNKNRNNNNGKKNGLGPVLGKLSGAITRMGAPLAGPPPPMARGLQDLIGFKGEDVLGTFPVPTSFALCEFGGSGVGFQGIVISPYNTIFTTLQPIVQQYQRCTIKDFEIYASVPTDATYPGSVTMGWTTDNLAPTPVSSTEIMGLRKRMQGRPQDFWKFHINPIREIGPTAIKRLSWQGTGLTSLSSAYDGLEDTRTDGRFYIGLEGGLASPNTKSITIRIRYTVDMFDRRSTPTLGVTPPPATIAAGFDGVIAFLGSTQNDFLVTLSGKGLITDTPAPIVRTVASAAQCHLVSKVRSGPMVPYFMDEGSINSTPAPGAWLSGQVSQLNTAFADVLEFDHPLMLLAPSVQCSASGTLGYGKRFLPLITPDSNADYFLDVINEDGTSPDDPGYKTEVLQIANVSGRDQGVTIEVRAYTTNLNNNVPSFTSGSFGGLTASPGTISDTMGAGSSPQSLLVCSNHADYDRAELCSPLDDGILPTGYDGILQLLYNRAGVASTRSDSVLADGGGPTVSLGAYSTPFRGLVANILSDGTVLPPRFTSITGISFILPAGASVNYFPSNYCKRGQINTQNLGAGAFLSSSLAETATSFVTTPTYSVNGTGPAQNIQARGSLDLVPPLTTFTWTNNIFVTSTTQFSAMEVIRQRAKDQIPKKPPRHPKLRIDRDNKVFANTDLRDMLSEADAWERPSFLESEGLEETKTVPPPLDPIFKISSKDVAKFRKEFPDKDVIVPLSQADFAHMHSLIMKQNSRLSVLGRKLSEFMSEEPESPDQ